MVNFFKKILFNSVLVLILLHTCIPHPHSHELTEKEHFEFHKKSNSLIGIISLAFHESDDENLDNLIFTQYESVKKIDSKHKYPKVSIFDNTTSRVGKIVAKKIVKWNTNNFNRLLFVKLNGLRGPPLLTNLINQKIYK
jgi:hypothetical protein